MSDIVESPAQAGHNNPPLWDEAQSDELMARLRAIADAGAVWGRNGVKNDQEAEQLTDYIGTIRTLSKDVEAARKAAKAPLDDKTKKIQAHFKALTGPLDSLLSTARELATSYATRKQEEMDRKRAEERARAEAAARRAEEESRKAQENGNIIDQHAADERLRQAQEAQEALAGDAKVTMQSASGGRSLSMKTKRTFKIIDVTALLVHYRRDPNVINAIHDCVRRDLRAKDVDDSSIPGIEITSTMEAV